MLDPDLLDTADERAPRYYWALLAWVVVMCLVIGLAAYLVSEA
ncbi:MAG: hypothetical protein Q8M09_12425 [Pseudomonadota bacterium]|nr:hypothetical protein [Pseudomonadota bacterium]MDP1905032.1 hypothetical protein [Pseudomonadota bacterium]MDP2354274.1 hypothetical protein [Pseudomonadota bacterium]